MCCAYYRQQFWRDPFISDLNPLTIDGSGESAWTNWWSYMQARKLVTMTTLWAATTRPRAPSGVLGERRAREQGGRGTETPQKLSKHQPQSLPLTRKQKRSIHTQWWRANLQPATTGCLPSHWQGWTPWPESHYECKAPTCPPVLTGHRITKQRGEFK